MVGGGKDLLGCADQQVAHAAPSSKPIILLVIAPHLVYPGTVRGATAGGVLFCTARLI